MKVKVKAPFYNDYGLFKKGDVLEVKKEDFDASLMDPVEESVKEPEEPKKAPAKTTAGKKKKA